MLLAIDVGNTSIVFAVYDGREQLCMLRSETNAPANSVLQELKTEHDIKAVVISSVVPNINDSLVNACEEELSVTAHLVKYQNVDIKVKLDNPKEIGADRLVNGYAVLKEYKAPAIVVDFGTATTFDVVDGEGAYAGGVISSGVNLSMKALYDATAQLPEIEIKKPSKVIGTDTIGAMQSGVYWGYIGMVEGIINRIKQEMGVTDITVIATGGLAPLFSDGTEIINFIDQDLTLKGLVHIYESLNNV